MIINEKITNLYESVINGDILTEPVLKNCGFTKEEVDSLVLENILECNNNNYKFLADSHLYEYGKKLFQEKEYDKAIKCYKRCLQINPNHEKAMCKIVENLINKDQLYDTLKYLNYKTNNNDINFYLYLLSFLIKLPEEHRGHVKKLTFDDVKSNNQSKIRKSAYDMKFSYALRQLNDDIVKNGSDEKKNLIKSLLIRVIRKEKRNMTILLNLIKEKEYEKIVSFIDVLEEKRKTSQPDKMLNLLASTILEVQQTRTIPEKRCTYLEEENLVQAILYNDYETALKINNEYNKKIKISNDESLMHLLLVDLCDLINDIKLEQIINKDKKEEEPPLTQEEKSRLKIMLEENIKLLENQKDVILLDDLSKKEIKYLQSIINNYQNVDIFTIGKEKVSAVLRPFANDDVYYELNNMYYFADMAYDEQDYCLCSEYYLEILKVGAPRSVAYFKLGLCYMKIEEYEKALIYFKIAHDLVYETKTKENIKNYILEINQILNHKNIVRVRNN